MEFILDYLRKYKFAASFVLAIGIMCWSVFYGEKETPLGVFGTILTSVGFVFTLSEVLTVKRVASDTQLEVSRAMGEVKCKIQTIFSLVDCVVAQKTIKEIEQYIDDDKFDVAAFRMHEVYKSLLILSKNVDISTFSEIDIPTLKQDITLDMQNFRYYSGRPEMIYKPEINVHLSNAMTLFIETENQLKYN